MLKSLFGAALLAVLPNLARAETLTPASVQQRLAARHPEIAAARRAALAEEARLEQVSLLPNPSLAWQREDLPGLERQDVFSLTVPLELSGRRAAGRALVRSEAALTRAQAATTQSAVIEAGLTLFYEALAAERRAAIARAALERLEEAGRVLAKRAGEGVAAGYDLHRLEIQIELGRVAVEQSEAELGALRGALALLVGSDDGALELRGSLAVGQSARSAAAANNADPGKARGARRALSEARRAVSEARSAADAAGSAWIPRIELNGGLRVVELSETHYGYVAGVSLEVPLFSHGQELGAEARARENVAEARAAALEQRASLDELTARYELKSALAEVERLRGAAEPRVEKVLRAAESSYREGTRPLLELLDAQTMASEIALRRLEAELRAKRAELKLRAARGDFE